MKKSEYREQIVDLKGIIKALIDEPDSAKAQLIKYRHNLSKSFETAEWDDKPKPRDIAEAIRRFQKSKVTNPAPPRMFLRSSLWRDYRFV